MSQDLFSLTVSSTGGTISVSIPNPSELSRTYLLTFTSPPDNRLTSSFIETFMLALDILQTKYPAGVLVTTSGIQKFYSNGLDLEHAFKTPTFWGTFGDFMRRLLTFPWPTVALVNGHAFAGGFITIMCHDYRVQNPSRGFLCMNEIEFGAHLNPHLTSIFRNKLANASLYRAVVLEAHRFPGKEALKEGIVDALGSWKEVEELVKSKELEKRGESGVYSQLRREMFRETYTYVIRDTGVAAGEKWMNEGRDEDKLVAEQAERNTRKWEEGSGSAKAKL